MAVSDDEFGPPEPIETSPAAPSTSGGAHPLKTTADVQEPSAERMDALDIQARLPAGFKAAPADDDEFGPPEPIDPPQPNPGALQFHAQSGALPSEAEAAEIIKYSAATGKPANLVAADLERIKREVDAQGVDWKTLAEKQPALAKYLADNRHAIPLAQKDTHSLGLIEVALTRPAAAVADFWHEVYKAHASIFGRPLDALGDAASDQVTTAFQFARAEGVKGLDETIQKRLDDAAKAQAEHGGEGYGATNFFGKSLVATAKFLPYMALDTGFRLTGGAIGGLFGGAAGAETGPGMAATGGGGVLLGQAIGSGLFNYAETLGPLSWQLDHMTDKNGQPIPRLEADIAAQMAAGMSGALLGALGPYGGRAAKFLQQRFAPGTSQLVSKLASSAVVKWLGDGEVRGVLSKFAARFGMHTALGAATMAANNAAVAVPVEIAKGNYPVGASYGDFWNDVWSTTADGAARAVKDLWLFSAASTGTGMAREAYVKRLADIGQAKASEEAGKRIAAAIQGAEGSTLLDKSPEAFKSIVQSANPDAKVYVPAERFVSYMQEKKLDPEQMAELVGVPRERLQSTLASGGDLEIKTADFLTGLAKDGHAQGLAEDVKSSPELLTAREFKSKQDAEVKRITEDAKRRDSELKEGKARIEQFVTEQAKAGGVKVGDVKEGARLLSEAVSNQALRLNVSMQEAAKLMNLGELTVSGQKGLTPEHQAAMDSFREWLAPSASQQLRAKFESMPDDAKTQRVFLDQNANIPNEKHYVARNESEAADSFGPDSGRAFAHVSVEGIKFVNDNLDHGKGDLLYRAAAKALHEAAPAESSLAKTGGDFELRVKDQAELDAILARANSLMPEQLRAFTLTGAADATREGAQAEHIKLKQKLEAEGKRTPRAAKGEVQQPPKGFTGDIKALQFPTEKAAGQVHPEVAHDFLKLSKEDRFTEAFVEPTTGLLTGLGWSMLDHDPGYHYAALDVRGLRDVNTKLGNENGDRMLAGFGAVVSHFGGSSFDAAHLHGDEYVLRHKDPYQLAKFVDTIREKLKGRFVVESPTGELHQLEVDFWHGIARGSYDAADRVLSERKDAAKKAAGPEQASGGEAERAGAGVEAPRGDGGGGARLDFRREDFGRGVSPQAYPGTREGSQAVLHQEAVAPKPVLEAQAFVGRMKNPEKKAIAQAFLDYVTGKSDRRPAGVPSALEQEFADKFGIVDPEGYSFGEDGRTLEKGLGGKKVRGEEPAELKRYRLMNLEHKTGEQQRYDQMPLGYVEGKQATFTQPAWHGSPHDFDKFSLHAIGTGEGAQVYGWGLYFAGNKETAEFYRKSLAAPVPTIDGKPVADLSAIERTAMHALHGSMENLGRGRLTIKKALPEAIAKLEREVEERRRSIPPSAPEDNPGLVRLRQSEKALELLRSLSPDRLSEKGGKLYEVDVPETHELLDYNATLDKQPAAVIAKLEAAGLLPDGKRVAKLIKDYLSAKDREGPAFEALTEELRAHHESGPKLPNGERFDGATKGRDIYRAIVEAKGSAEAASKALDEAGVPGMRYLDSGSRGAGEGSHNYVIWSDDRVNVLRKHYQEPLGGDSGPRGEIHLDMSGSGRPRAFDIRILKADKSTFVHEAAHFLSWSLHDLATSDLATEQHRRDYETLLKFAGYGSAEERLKATLEKTNAKQEEKISHAFEQYLLEGRAPSTSLARVFSRLKGWLVSLYKGAQGIAAQYQSQYGQPLELSDDVRGVFDRLLAQDEALKRAADAVGGAKEVREALAGMTPAEAKAYREALATSSVKAEQETAEGGEERQKKLDAQREAFRAQTESELDAKPVYQAWRYLQHGDSPEGMALTDNDGKPFKLDREAFVQAYGDEAAKRMPPGSLKAKGGVKADILAPLLGYSSGDDMVRALTQAVPRDEAIRQGTQDKMDAAYGPELERAAEAALSGVHNDAALQAAVLELRGLAKQINPEVARRAQVVDVEAIRRSIDALTAAKPVGELDPANYARTERRLAIEAAELWGKKEYEASYDKREQRLVNKILFMSERDAKRELAQAKKKMANPSPAVQAELGKADPAYRDAHNGILAAVGLMAPAKEPGLGLDDALAAAERDGHDMDGWVDTVRGLLDNPRPWSKLSVSEARDVVDGIAQLKHVADETLHVVLNGKKADRLELQRQIADRAKSVRPPVEPKHIGSQKERLVSKVEAKRRAASAILQDFESVAEMLDGGTTGPVHDYVLGGYLKSREHFVEMVQRALAPIKEAFEKIPPELRKLREQAVDVDHLLPPYDDRAVKMTRGDLWMVFLNLGNEGNIQRLVDGNKWDKANMLKAVSMLTHPELEFLQTVRDVANNVLYPELAKAYERRKGLKLGKVEAAPILVNGREYAGGYWPIRYDKGASGAQGVLQEFNDIKDILPSAGTPTVTNSATKARQNYVAAPLDLSWGVVPAHFAQVIHDIAYGDWVRQVGKLAFKPRVPDPVVPSLHDTVTRYAGPERAAELLPLIRDIAGARADSSAGHISQAIKDTGFLRSRFASAAIMLNIPSLFRHSLDAFTTRSDSEGIPYPRIAAAYAQVMNPASWGKNSEFSLSKELEYRHVMHDENLRNELTKMGKVSTAMQRANEVGFLVHKWVDMFTTRVAFKAAFGKFRAEGATPEEAAERADGVVRRNFPSGDIMEKPPILRTKQGWAAAVMFYGYAAKMHNLRSRAFDQLYRGWVADGLERVDPTAPEPEGRAHAIASVAAKMIGLGLVSAMGGYIAFRGPTKKEDEEKGLAASRAEWLATEVLLSPMDDAPPIVGPALKATLLGHKTNIASVPELSLIDGQLQRLGRLLHGKKQEDESAAWDMVATLVGLLGPMGQAQRTVPYLRDVASGKERPRNAADFAAGAIGGNRKTRGASPLSDLGDAVK